MEFRILGPLDVLKNGASLQVSAPRELTLLAVLILEANRVVPVSRLIDAIWDGSPPQTARRQVQICVSTLRKLLAPAADGSVIITRSPGYQLDVTGQTVDAIQFEELTAAGRDAAGRDAADGGGLLEAIRSLRAALGLWRGSAAADVDSRIVQIAATRLNEKRMTTTEACIGLELRSGHHVELIGELSSLVAEYPLREKLRAQQMIALYRTGRRAEALAAYQEARRAFVDDLGLDLGQELRKLERAILTGDPSLDLASQGSDAPTVPVGRRSRWLGHVPRQLPADIPDFTGREHLVSQLSGVLTSADAPGHPARPMRVAVLTGEHGVGKTTLAVHVAHALADYFPDGQLFVQLGGSDLHPASADQVAERCLRAIGVSPADIAAGPARPPEMCRSLLAARRILVVLDDAASLTQVLALLPGGGNCGVVVTSSCRLPGLLGAHSFEVEIFPPATALEMLSRALGDPQPELATLAKLCGFWPFALRLVAAELIDSRHRTLRQLVRRLSDGTNPMVELRWGLAADLPDREIPVSLLNGGIDPPVRADPITGVAGVAPVNPALRRHTTGAA